MGLSWQDILDPAGVVHHGGLDVSQQASNAAIRLAGSNTTLAQFIGALNPVTQLPATFNDIKKTVSQGGTDWTNFGNELGTSGVGGVIRSVVVDPVNMVAGIPEAIRTGNFGNVGNAAGRFYATGAAVVGAAYLGGAALADGGATGAGDAAVADETAGYEASTVSTTGTDLGGDYAGETAVQYGPPVENGQILDESAFSETFPTTASSAAPASASDGFWTTLERSTATGLGAGAVGSLFSRGSAAAVPTLSSTGSGKAPVSGGTSVNVGTPGSSSGAGGGLGSLFGNQPGSLVSALGGGSNVALIGAAALAAYFMFKKHRAAA